MFSSLFSLLNSLIYTFLAFCLPLYFTVKALLRQYTVSIVAPTSFASACIQGNDDSEVPSSFIEEPTMVKSHQKTAEASSSSVSAPSASTSSWLHYWAILAVVHCFTGLYERTLLRIFGNSFLYHCAKYFALYWLARDEAQASRTLWTAVVAPFAAKYEKEVDLFVQNCREQGRQLVTKSVASLREISRKSFQNATVKAQ